MTSLFSDGENQYRGRVLIVDDDPQILQLLSCSLEREGYRAETANCIYAMKQSLKRFLFDAVLLDVYLGEDSGFDGLSYLMKEFPLTKVIVMTARDSVDLAVHAMEKGALTFVPKAQGAEYLVDIVKEKLAQEHIVTPSVGDTAQKMGMIGKSEAICSVIRKVEQLKDIHSTVLIVGETGTGKELVARALHTLSTTRSKGRYEAINCSAIPDTLLEAELFGYKRGAFTDAKTDRSGLFQICTDGTLLLDEIGDMPMLLQSKVLRVLQEGEVRPVGGSNTFKINTRIIAATHRNLFAEKERGRFREDLYYRLSVLLIEIPPLRERPEDIPVLVQHFLDFFNTQFQKTVEPPPRYIMDRLRSYGWPGNVRELRNAIERAVVLSQNGQLGLEDILPQTNANGSYSRQGNGNGTWPVFPLSLVEAKKTFEKNYITQLLMAADGNISEAARIAGKHRAEIYRLIEKHKIDQNSFRNNE